MDDVVGDDVESAACGEQRAPRELRFEHKVRKGMLQGLSGFSAARAAADGLAAGASSQHGLSPRPLDLPWLSLLRNRRL